MKSAGLILSSVNIALKQAAVFLNDTVSLYLCACCALQSICYACKASVMSAKHLLCLQSICYGLQAVCCALQTI